MTRHRWSRRLTFLVFTILGPVVIGCEAILDFDRTPLQPVPDANFEEASDETPGVDAGKKDARPQGDDDDDDDKPDASDAGKDAGDGGDAGDAGDQNR
jgi:hypothetical protein